MAQPEFGILSAAFTDAGQQLALMPNVPAINQGALLAVQLQQIQQQLQQQLQQQQQEQQQIQQQLQQQHQQQQQQQQQLFQMIQEGFQSLEARLDASDKNSIARLSNAAISNTATPLSPIFTRNNEIRNGFPETLADVTGLNGNSLTALLDEYDQPSNGSVAAKRKRFRRYIGIVIDLG